jgi:hypothetical protein
MISITLLALALSHHGVGAASLPDHPPGTIDKSPDQTQANEINVARECAATCSPVRQCHIEKQLTRQLYRLGYGSPPIICGNVTKCKEHCVELRPTAVPQARRVDLKEAKALLEQLKA